MPLDKRNNIKILNDVFSRTRTSSSTLDVHRLYSSLPPPPSYHTASRGLEASAKFEYHRALYRMVFSIHILVAELDAPYGSRNVVIVRKIIADGGSSPMQRQLKLTKLSKRSHEL